MAHLLILLGLHLELKCLLGGGVGWVFSDQNLLFRLSQLAHGLFVNYRLVNVAEAHMRVNLLP